MKKIITGCALVLSLLLPSQALAQYQEDIKGWGKTEWGMSQEQVLNLYSEIKLKNRADDVIVYVIEEYQIDNFSYTIYLTFDKDKGLIEVEYEYKDLDNNNGYSAYWDLKTMLENKYGKPVVDSNVHNTFYAEWILPSTDLELTNRFSLNNSGSRTNLTYTPRVVDDRI